MMVVVDQHQVVMVDDQVVVQAVAVVVLRLKDRHQYNKEFLQMEMATITAE